MIEDDSPCYLQGSPSEVGGNREVDSLYSKYCDKASTEERWNPNLDLEEDLV